MGTERFKSITEYEMLRAQLSRADRESRAHTASRAREDVSRKSADYINDIVQSVNKLKTRYIQNEAAYEISIPSWNKIIGMFRFPPDNQFILDAAALETITDVLSQRYDIKKNKIKETSTHSAYKANGMYCCIYYNQVGPSRYEFFIQDMFIGWIETPADWCMGQDLSVIKEICKACGQRFRLI